MSRYLILVYFFLVFPQFWDTRSSNPILTVTLPERCYCADVVSVVGNVMTFLIQTALGF